MRFQNGISDFPRRTPWWALIRNGLMAAIPSYNDTALRTGPSDTTCAGQGRSGARSMVGPPTDQPVRKSLPQNTWAMKFWFQGGRSDEPIALCWDCRRVRGRERDICAAADLPG